MNPLEDAFYQARLKELEGRVSPKRLKHIEGVAAMAVTIARAYGVDEGKARLAGLLHDWDKGYDDAGIRRRADELGLDVPREVYEDMPQTLHGITAAKALSVEFPEIPEDVIRAIANHTTASKDMSPLDMALYCADGLELGRRGDDLARLRERIGQEPLEDLFFQVLGLWTIRIIERCKTLHPSTIDVWNHYAQRFKMRTVGEYVTEFGKGNV